MTSSIKREEMEFTISPNGDKVNVHVQGIKGKQCLDATELIESKLGIVETREHTREMNQQPEKRVVNVSRTRN
jgi:hypothetical protein